MSTATLLRYQPSLTERRRSSSSSSGSSNNSTNSDIAISNGRISPSNPLFRDTLQYHQCLVNDKQAEVGRLNALINNLKNDEQCFKDQFIQWYNTAETELNELKDKMSQMQNNSKN